MRKLHGCMALSMLAVLASDLSLGQVPAPATPPETAAGNASKTFPATALLSQLPTILPDKIDLGPLNFTFGPQENGEFGAVLSGGDSIPLNSISSGMPAKLPTTNFWLYYGAAEYNVDASWTSGSDTLNQSTISLKPQITFVSLTPAEPEKVLVDPSNDALCGELEKEFEEDAEGDSSILEEFLKECGTKGKAPGQRFALTLLGDALYRYGEFNIDGTQYHANQLLFGGGVRVFLPQATRTPLFREWPRLTVAYYSVADNAQSTLPDPDEFKLDTIAADSRLRMRVPMPGKPWGLSPVHLDIDLRASKPTEGADRDWEYFREFQLSVDMGKEWKPAVTYRSGDDKGLQYDRQIILGVLLELLK